MQHVLRQLLPLLELQRRRQMHLVLLAVQGAQALQHDPGQSALAAEQVELPLHQRHPAVEQGDGGGAHCECGVCTDMMWCDAYGSMHSGICLSLPL